MPNCFQLVPIGKKEAAKLCDVDIELCNVLGCPVSDTTWVLNWYNTIGFCMALGDGYKELRDRFGDDTEYEKIISYLENSYTIRAWVER